MSKHRVWPPSSRPPSSPPQRSGSRRLVIWTTVGYSVVMLLLAALGGSQLHEWARQRIVQLSVLAEIDQTPVAAATQVAAPAADALAEQPAPAEAAAEVAAPAEIVKPINILLLGTDERPDEFGPTRTDTIIVLSINPKTGVMGMISLPRDLWVPIPSMGITTKINTAYMLGELRDYPGGGYQLAKDTISSFIGRRIDYYARVNFDGFREIVDLVGGVDVDVPYTIHDEQYPTSDYGVETFHLEAGLQHLDGETALKYARTRNVDGDYSRARRQQDIIRSVADKVLNANMIPQLLPRVPQLLVAMQNSIETDMPVPLGLELSKVIKLDLIKNMQHLVLDNQYGQETFSSEGAWILVPDRTRVRAALDQFYAPITQSSSALSVAAGTPGGLRIEVLNGTSQPGAASRTAQLLESQGWPVVSIGDADRSDYGQTIVINYGAPDALVERVITDLSLEPTNARLNGLHAPSPVDVRIVVGQDILPTLK